MLKAVWNVFWLSLSILRLKCIHKGEPIRKMELIKSRWSWIPNWISYANLHCYFDDKRLNYDCHLSSWRLFLWTYMKKVRHTSIHLFQKEFLIVWNLIRTLNSTCVFLFIGLTMAFEQASNNNFIKQHKRAVWNTNFDCDNIVSIPSKI